MESDIAPDKAVERRRYQRRAYLRRKQRYREMYESRLTERAEKLKRDILESGGVLYSSISTTEDV
jgi:hypothetical protein